MDTTRDYQTSNGLSQKENDRVSYDGTYGGLANMIQTNYYL